MLSFLWYLAGCDEAYAMLVLLKRQRMTGGRKARADFASLLAAEAAGLAAMAAPPGPAAAAPAGPAARQAPAAAPVSGPRRPPNLPAIAPSSAGGSVPPSEAGDAAPAAPPGPPPPAPNYLDPADPNVLPALQLAALLSQDIQQLYRASFRDAMAGISSVVYPPPVSTGRLDVHDVWR